MTFLNVIWYHRESAVCHTDQVSYLGICPSCTSIERRWENDASLLLSSSPADCLQSIYPPKKCNKRQLLLISKDVLRSSVDKVLKNVSRERPSRNFKIYLALWYLRASKSNVATAMPSTDGGHDSLSISAVFATPTCICELQTWYMYR